MVNPRVVSVMVYVSVTAFDDVTEIVALPFCAVTVTGGGLPLIFVPESTLDVVMLSVSLTGAKLLLQSNSCISMVAVWFTSDVDAETIASEL